MFSKRIKRKTFLGYNLALLAIIFIIGVAGTILFGEAMGERIYMALLCLSVIPSFVITVWRLNDIGHGVIFAVFISVLDIIVLTLEGGILSDILIIIDSIIWLYILLKKSVY